MSNGASLRRSRQPVLVVTLLVVIALLVAGATFLAFTVRVDRQQIAMQAQAVHAARQEAINLVTLDYTSLEADIANVLAGATGDFREQYRKGADQVRKIVTDNQVRSTADVLEAGIVLPADTRSVTVLVVVDSTVRNKADQKGQRRHYRIQLQMAKDKGGWRASTLDFIS
ncbi:MAG: hypothetical protein DLM59_03010 [Pseudonocardiales bacterium]|nr:MAG: hypothetical protein DLM59_03010 [Pseudonocardiales bacterium]